MRAPSLKFVGPLGKGRAQKVLMGTFLLIFQIITAIVFIVIMAVQTDKNEQSGVMGIGAQGGRMSGSIDMPVGAERILKPLAKWMAVGFLFASSLAAMHGEYTQRGASLPWWILLMALTLYVFVMLMGDKIYQNVMRALGASQ